MKTKEKLPKLYQVYSKAKNFHNYKETLFNWFVSDREKPLIPYEKGIENYEKGNISESVIDGLFTKQEAEQLVAYLEKEHKGDNLEINIEEQKLPIENNVIGLGALPAGGMTDFLIVYLEKNYNLPFKVLAYYDLRQSKF